ncbi:hypothetical protein DS745_02370 [Anaerobacillus alkaliphilus]|uniref:Uncharacterized protein n=1 Tax=Anaerobacillus alkaliphilus TaxID=1548597 RepID=A0A4Q0VXQ0_9BACI|nr:hypothetical protein [Anaerobacillus alkaliphilus]RXJ04250.1 hypothetical protein DS745_02370 [Anaerobacillus alkaliphilus]
MTKQIKILLVISILLNAILMYQLILNKSNLESSELFGQIYFYNSISNLNNNLKSISSTLELYGELLTENELLLFNQAIETERINILDARSNIAAAMPFNNMNFSIYYENYLLNISKLLCDIVEGQTFHKNDINALISSLKSANQNINNLFSQGIGNEGISSELSVKAIYGDLERVNRQVELVYRK